MPIETPTLAGQISKHIVDQGGFCDGLAYVTKFMRSNTSSTLIIRGDIGCGKKTVVKQAEDMLKGNAICVYLKPQHPSDDFSAIRTIVRKLKLNVRPSIQEMITEIEERSDPGSKVKKIVIVLYDFEEFCRQRQTLLYSLTHLTQHGKNISLICITKSLDCTKNLEKRVRSRMNALCYELKPPYTNKEEYVHFASILLGKYKITGKLKEQLEYMYIVGDRSIRQLKQYLNQSTCNWTEKGRLIVHEPTEIFDPQNDLQPTNTRLHRLTKTQLELIKVIVCCCDSYERTDFNLALIDSYTNKHEYHSFDTDSDIAIADMVFLIKIGFLIALKPQEGIDRQTQFSINITPIQLKRILQKDSSLHFRKSDPLWKKIMC